MDVIDRVKEIIEFESLTRDELTIRTSIGYTRWQSVINRKAKIRHEEIEAIGEAFPEYKMWLAYGEEMPEAGQVSPKTKRTTQDYGKTGGD